MQDAANRSLASRSLSERKVGKTMDAAFGLRAAAPAPGALVFADAYDRRARRTADRGVALRYQRMRWQAVCGDIVGNVGDGPACQRIHLHVRAVVLEDR